MSYIGAIDKAAFDKMVEDARVVQDRIKQIVENAFTRGIHYGLPSGEDKKSEYKRKEKPTLLKPGADDGLALLGLVPDFLVDTSFGDGEMSPAFSVVVRAEAHVGDLSGPVVGVGYWAGNTHETKFRYRWKWNPTNRVKEKTLNEDPLDLQNNVIKYSVKRAAVDLALRLGFGTYFTQDLDEVADDPLAKKSDDPFAPPKTKTSEVPF